MNSRQKLFERRIMRLEKLMNEALKESAIDEIRDIIDSWNLSSSKLMKLRAEIMRDAKNDLFGDLVSEIEINDNETLAFYLNSCNGSSSDDLYYCEELDNDVLDIIDEMLNL